MLYNKHMHWEFQIGWSIAGLVAMIAGVLITRYHKQIADEIAGGVMNYDKVKLAGLLAIGVGFIFLTCLHTTIFYLFLHIIAPGRF